jgi:hypothetical protein
MGQTPGYNSKAQLTRPVPAFNEAGGVNGTAELHLVICVVWPDTCAAKRKADAHGSLKSTGDKTLLGQFGFIGASCDSGSIPPAQVTGARECPVHDEWPPMHCARRHGADLAFGALVFSIAGCVVDFIASAWEQDVDPLRACSRLRVLICNSGNALCYAPVTSAHIWHLRR